MKYKWIDYDYDTHKFVDEWLIGNVKEFATYDDVSFKEEWDYYINSSDYHVGIDAFCKVIYDNEDAVGIIILLNTDKDDDKLTINPLIINPKYQNHGYGTRIIKDLIDNINIIIPNHNSVLFACIDLKNIASVKAFTKCGFIQKEILADGDFAYYEYDLKSK